MLLLFLKKQHKCMYYLTWELIYRRFICIYKSMGLEQIIESSCKYLSKLNSSFISKFDRQVNINWPSYICNNAMIPLLLLTYRKAAIWTSLTCFNVLVVSPIGYICCKFVKHIRTTWVYLGEIRMPHKYEIQGLLILFLHFK